MEKKREKSEVATIAFSRGGVQSSMDDFGTGPGRDGGPPGIDSRKDLAVTLRIGESRLRQTAERGRWILDVGEYPEGCGVVAPERDSRSYPCYHCPGGTQFDACERIRGG